MFNKIVSSIGEFSYRNRKIISIFALVLFACFFTLQSQAVIEYSYSEESIITDAFAQDDTIVLVYENEDEEKLEDVVRYLEQDEHITSVQTYANTLGAKMTANDLSVMMGIPANFVDLLFYLHQNGMAIEGMPLTDFVDFISSDDFLNNELLASSLDEETKAQILQMKNITEAISSQREYTASEISQILGINTELVQVFFYIAQLRNTNISNVVPTFLSTVADIFGIDAELIERLFNEKPVKALKFTEFIDLVLTFANYAEDLVGAEYLSQLSLLKEMANAITNQTPLLPSDISKLFASSMQNDAFNEQNLTLLYLFAQSSKADMSNYSLPLYDFFNFLANDILSNDAFSSFFDESVATQFAEAKTTMEDGKAQLVGENHSRLIFTLDYPPESPAINDFYKNFSQYLDQNLSGEFYLVGATAMSYEVSQTFKREYLIISIVTALVVFAVVLLTFKKLSISLLLICVIECAVFAMMSVMVISSTPTYFIALILVQCILMGSMIDYGILFTTYYMEVRKEFTLEQALPETMKRATPAILTSSLIIILVTLVCGMFMAGAVATILKTLGIGALCAIFLILFVLPSLLVIFDKSFIKQMPVKAPIA